MSVFLIKNGVTYHPLKHKFCKQDLVVEGEKIAAGRPEADCVEIDADGCIVVPGLIDYHVHYFNRGTENGVNPDAASFPCGVTTAVDGGSCGAAHYELYRTTVMANSDVRIYNLLLAASGGQITDRYPEHLEARYFDRDKICQMFERYPDNLVGLKSRMSKGIIAPEDAEESMKETVKLASETGGNVVVHITNPVMNLERLGELLRPGDVICHCYQDKGTENILNPDGTVRRGILEARARGVLFDSSNGCNNYDLEVCRRALAQGFVPDIISSDVNTSGMYLQPLHSLPRIMSKYLALGMKLEDILDAVILKPAQLIHREDLASLDAGTEADLTILKLKEKNISYCDKAGHLLEGTRVLVPQWTMKGGKVMYCQADFC